MFGFRNISCINFFRFFQSLVSLKNAKNWIRIICDYSSNTVDKGLKIWQKICQIKCFHIVNTKFDFFGGRGGGVRFYMLTRLDTLLYLYDVYIIKRMWIEIPILLPHRFYKVLLLRKYPLLDFGFLTKEASWIHRIFKIWCHGEKI